MRRHQHRCANSVGRSHRIRRRFSADARGFTLIEILIALGIFLFVLFAVYTTFETSRSTYAAGEQKADIQQTARLAMELMEHDLRLAGYGFPKSGPNCTPNPPNAIVNADETRVTFRADLFNATTIISNVDVSPGNTTLNVEDGSVILADDIIYLNNGAECEQLTVQSVNTGGDPHTITATTGATTAYPWGTQVGRPLSVTYCVCAVPDDPGPEPWVCEVDGTTLCKDDGDGAGLQPLVANIQSLQFRYFPADTAADSVGSETANPDEIRRIIVTLTAESPPGWWRPQVFTITSDVRPRNL